jgi:glycosyltransferase involved in cell wall biosynthesis
MRHACWATPGLLALRRVDVLLDYRPALVARTGVGEYVHELAAGLARRRPTGAALHLFSSSWKDRLRPPSELRGDGIVLHDYKIPVRVLHAAWHRLEAPSIERLTRRGFDVVHSAHPLLIPARAGARVATVYDLDFLEHPERTTGEVLRDYPSLIERHAARADGILAISETTRRAVIERLHLAPERVLVARAGVPRWAQGGRTRPRRGDGPILFLGTLEPRKNVGALLDAYGRLRSRRDGVPRLTLAGRVTPAASAWLDTATRNPLAAHVDVLGYVPDDHRRGLLESASMLVLPSWNEGFGLPVLEALALELPVVVSNRGALPEVAGDAALYCDPADPDSLSDAIASVLDDPAAAERRAAAGRARVASWSWDDAADRVWSWYGELAAANRGEAQAHRR